MKKNRDICPLAETETRLSDALILWVQAKKDYFLPHPFRRTLNSLIQTLRSVTFILQKNKERFIDYEAWYGPWQETMRADPIMKWLIEARNVVVKEGDLKTRSVARVAMVDSWFDTAGFEIEVTPLARTEDFIRLVAKAKPADYVSAIPLLRIERKWIDSMLPDKELLEALAHVFDVLHKLVFDAHEKLLDPKVFSSCDWFREVAPFKGRKPPCMVAQDMDRTLWMNYDTGDFMLPDSIPLDLDEKLMQKVTEKYPEALALKDKLRSAETLEKEVDVLFEQAKLLLVKDGYHDAIVIFGYEDGTREFHKLELEDRAEKHIIYRRLAAHAEKTVATSVVFITENWVSPISKVGSFQHAGDDPDRKEALQIVAADSKGKVVSRTVAFNKDKKGDIQIGNELASENAIVNFLEPFRKAWKL